jgi:hypothetical protein
MDENATITLAGIIEDRLGELIAWFQINQVRGNVRQIWVELALQQAIMRKL